MVFTHPAYPALPALRELPDEPESKASSPRAEDRRRNLERRPGRLGDGLGCVGVGDVVEIAEQPDSYSAAETDRLLDPEIDDRDVVLTEFLVRVSGLIGVHRRA